MGMTSSYTGEFNYAYVPSKKELWSAQIGDNDDLTCHIRRDNLTIRMGDDSPELGRQHPGSTASFEILGDPRIPAIQTPAYDIRTGGVMALWTNDPKLTGTQIDAVTSRWASGSPVTVRVGTRFVQSSWHDLRGVGHAMRVRVTHGAPYSHSHTQTGAGLTRINVLTARPWTPGFQLVHQWDLDGSQVTTPDFIGKPGYWIQVEGLWEAARDFTTNAMLMSVQYPIIEIIDYEPDTFDVGEKVVLSRNGQKIWTGWVTDETREWAPSGETVRVNAAGPRPQAEAAMYTQPAIAVGQQFGNWVARTSIDVKNQTGVDHGFYNSLSGPLLGNVLYDADQARPKAMEVADAAASATGGLISESRDGQVTAFGRSWFTRTVGVSDRHTRSWTNPTWHDLPAGLTMDDFSSGRIAFRQPAGYWTGGEFKLTVIQPDVTGVTVRRGDIVEVAFNWEFNVEDMWGNYPLMSVGASVWDGNTYVGRIGDSAWVRVDSPRTSFRSVRLMWQADRDLTVDARIRTGFTYWHQHKQQRKVGTEIYALSDASVTVTVTGGASVLKVSACNLPAPVTVRTVLDSVTAWEATWGTAPDSALSETFSQPVAGRDYPRNDNAPLMDRNQALAMWNYLSGPASRHLEVVDRWRIPRWSVPEPVWDRLLYWPLGHPIQITDIPVGLFRDNRTEVLGFLWGWSLNGADEVEVTIVDARKFA